MSPKKAAQKSTRSRGSVDETSGLEATETFLQQEPDLAMVIGINDAGALGAYQAMQTAIAENYVGLPL